MAKWRKKPVVVEAEVYRPGLEDGFGPNPKQITDAMGTQKICPFIDTLEGKHFISRGDYIITGVQGERYPCKPDIFLATYEPAE